MDLFVTHGNLGRKIVEVADRLYENERAIKHDGHDGDECDLAVAIDRAGNRSTVVGQYQRETGDRDKRGQSSGVNRSSKSERGK